MGTKENKAITMEQFPTRIDLPVDTRQKIGALLMVFLIQNTQNRDSEAMQVKLDELIRAIEGAHNALLDLEELEQDDLDRIRDGYEKLAEQARAGLREPRQDQNKQTMS